MLFHATVNKWIYFTSESARPEDGWMWKWITMGFRKVKLLFDLSKGQTPVRKVKLLFDLSSLRAKAFRGIVPALHKPTFKKRKNWVPSTPKSTGHTCLTPFSTTKKSTLLWIHLVKAEEIPGTCYLPLAQTLTLRTQTDPDCPMYLQRATPFESVQALGPSKRRQGLGMSW